jgi:DNA-binding response OmpR family regulator
MEIPKAAKVAILNSNEDLMEILTFALKEEGFDVVFARVPEIRRGKKDLVGFLKEHNPAIIIYDIPPPYEENWRFFLLLRNLKITQGKHFILTTTNKSAIEKLIGNIETIEIYGKPYDLKEVVTAVKLAINLDIQPEITTEDLAPRPQLITDPNDKS